MENTLIIFTSDNGPYSEEGGDRTSLIATGYTEVQTDLYEGEYGAYHAVWNGNIPSGRESGCFRVLGLHAYLRRTDRRNPPTQSDGEHIADTAGGRGARRTNYLYLNSWRWGRQADTGGLEIAPPDIRDEGDTSCILRPDRGNHNIKQLFPEKTEELKTIMQEARVDDPSWPLF